MTMYLGNKPVKAIARSKNNLFDISKVTGIRSYATDRDESEWFQHNGNILKIGRSAYNSIVVLSGIEFYLTEGTYSLSFKVCNNENEKMSIRSALYLSGDYPYKSLGVGYTNLLPYNSTTITRTFTVTTAGTYYISIQPGNVGVTSWIRNVLFYNIQFNPGDPLPYEPYNQLFTVPIKKCVGKNLFDINAVTQEIAYDDEGYWYTPNRSYYHKFYNLRLQAGKTYTFSANVKTTATEGIGSKLSFAIVSGKDKHYNSGTARVVTQLLSTFNPYRITATFTVPEGVSWASLCVCDWMRYKDLQIELGSTATEYEPYREWYEY